MVFFHVFSRLPLRLLYIFSDVLYLLLRYVVRYRWAVVLQNLQNAFPGLSPAERRRVANAFYRNLTDVFVETLKALSLSEGELRRRVRVVNPELYEPYLRAGQTVLMMTAHQGNWEWQSLGVRVLGPAVDAVYQPLSSAFFDRLMRQIRGRFGITPLPMQGLLRDMAKRRGQPRLIGLVADQAAPPETAYWTRFLNQETDFFVGTDKLARQFGCPVLVAEMRRVRRGYYELEFHSLAEPPYDTLPPLALIEAYVRKLEVSIQHHPADWLWSHRRWKHTPPRRAAGQE
jgi:KDO2-lipid IV(A) lauroyltransferase